MNGKDSLPPIDCIACLGRGSFEAESLSIPGVMGRSRCRACNGTGKYPHKDRDLYDDCAQDLQVIISDVDTLKKLVRGAPSGVDDCVARIDRAVIRLASKLRTAQATEKKT